MTEGASLHSWRMHMQHTNGSATLREAADAASTHSTESRAN